jgi:acyl carrier protein
MKRNVIQSKLTDIFRRIFEEPNLTLREDLTSKDIAKWDSLAHLIMIKEVEKSFGIKLMIKEISKIRNVGDIVSMIETKVNEG